MNKCCLFYNESMKNKGFLPILTYYICIFAFFILLTRAKIGGCISPFSFAFLFALIYLNRNEYVLAPLFSLAYILVYKNMQGIVIGIFVGVMAILCPLTIKIFKQKMSYLKIAIFLLLSQSVYISYHVGSANEILQTVATIVSSQMFCYMSVCAMSAVFSRGLYGKLAFDENVCLGIIISSLSLGLIDIYFFDIWVLTTIITFTIPFLIFTMGHNHALYFATMCGVGICFGNLSIVPLAIFVAYATCSIALKDAGRIVSSVSILVVDVVVGLLLNAYPSYSYYNLIAVGIGIIAFLCIPSKVLKNIELFVGNGKENYLDNIVLETNKLNVRQKLTQSSNIFYCLSKSYKELVSGKISREDATDAMVIDIKNRICAKCERKADCIEFGEKDLENGFKTLCENALAKSKANIVDVPPLLSSECNKVPSILTLVNEDTNDYNKFCGRVQQENKGRLEIAEQFYQTGFMIDCLKDKLSASFKRNIDKERKLSEELLFMDIIAKEVNVYETKEGVKSVILILRNLQAQDDRIKQVLQDFFKIKFSLKKRELSIMSGWSVLEYGISPNFDVVVGVAGSSKDSISGDNKFTSAISESQVMAVIADGMGSGKEANKISNITLDIIENFYKAGFGSDFIIKSVNKFLNFSNKEVFSTVDICLIDKVSARADFIKMGSSVSVIKRKNSAFKVSPENLPVGIVDKVKVNIQKYALSLGDIIVLASDGVVDSFPSEDYYVSFVNSLRLINAKLIADTILEQAIYNYRGNKRDDMSVVVLRLVDVL